MKCCNRHCCFRTRRCRHKRSRFQCNQPDMDRRQTSLECWCKSLLDRWNSADDNHCTHRHHPCKTSSHWRVASLARRCKCNRVSSWPERKFHDRKLHSEALACSRRFGGCNSGRSMSLCIGSWKVSIWRSLTSRLNFINLTYNFYFLNYFHTYVYDPGRLTHVAPFWQPKSVPAYFVHSSTSTLHVGPSQFFGHSHLNVSYMLKQLPPFWHG